MESIIKQVFGQMTAATLQTILTGRGDDYRFPRPSVLWQLAIVRVMQSSPSMLAELLRGAGIETSERTQFRPSSPGSPVGGRDSSQARGRACAPDAPASATFDDVAGNGLRILFGFLFAGFPQSDADPATVVVDEVDAGRGARRMSIRRPSRLASGNRP